MTRLVEQHDERKSWDEKWHHFWYAATPRIFEWFGWVAVLGALGFIYAKNPTPVMLGLLALGYLSLLFYFTAFFMKHPLKIPGVRIRRNQELISGLLALGLAYATNWVAQHAVAAFAQSAL